jgi:prevent-host-death family protein
MGTTVSITEAKTHLSKLLARVEKGETFIITKAGTPVVALRPYTGTSKPAKRRRSPRRASSPGELQRPER